MLYALARTYDRAGRPLTISGGPGGTRTFDHAGPTTETYSGGFLEDATITDSRDTFGRFTGQSLTLGGQPVATTAYTYGLSSRLDGAALVSNGQTLATGYGYHPTRGYLQITTTGLVAQSAITTTRNLDAAGRIDSIQTTGPGSAIISGRTYQRDHAGKITHATLPDNDYWFYGYDDKNQVNSGTRHQSGGTILNGLGNRQNTTPITLLPAYDSNGNIISLTDAATATKAITYEYDAFGQQVIKTNHAALENKPAALIEAVESNHWSFSTKPEDRTTGLHYYGYRFYNATAGRWINRDPIEEQGGVNLYGFVRLDGINQVDVLGEKNYAQGDGDPTITPDAGAGT